MKMSNKLKNFFKGGKVKDERPNLANVLNVQNESEPKKVTVKINIDREGRYFLDENGKEVVMLDSVENYVKKITTENKKVQDILRRYVEEN